MSDPYCSLARHRSLSLLVLVIKAYLWPVRNRVQYPVLLVILSNFYPALPSWVILSPANYRGLCLVLLQSWTVLTFGGLREPPPVLLVISSHVCT